MRPYTLHHTRPPNPTPYTKKEPRTTDRQNPGDASPGAHALAKQLGLSPHSDSDTPRASSLSADEPASGRFDEPASARPWSVIGAHMLATQLGLSPHEDFDTPRREGVKLAASLGLSLGISSPTGKPRESANSSPSNLHDDREALETGNCLSVFSITCYCLSVFTGYYPH